MAWFTKEELAGMLGQELGQKLGVNDQAPERFIHKEGFPEAIDPPDHLWRDTLTVDPSLLSSSSPSELGKLRSALSTWGCFQAINHGISREMLDEVLEVTKEFYGMGVEERVKHSAEDDIFQGYGSQAVYAGSQILNWNDRLYLTIFPLHQRKLNFWPPKPARFSCSIALKIPTLIKNSTLRTTHVSLKSEFHIGVATNE